MDRISERDVAERAGVDVSYVARLVDGVMVHFREPPVASSPLWR